MYYYKPGAEIQLRTVRLGQNTDAHAMGTQPDTAKRDRRHARGFSEDAEAGLERAGIQMQW